MSRLQRTDPGQSPILVVDDDAGLLLSIKTILISEGLPEPLLVSDSTRVMALIRQQRFRLVMLDLTMPKVGGIELLKQIKTEYPETECLIVTATDDIESAVQAVKYGAYDYLVKPVDRDKLVISVNRALERYNLRQGLALYETRPLFSDLKNPEAFAPMVAEDDAMARVFHQVETVAPTDYSVVITGESGTGKEMLARILHSLSKRAAEPFLAVNMAAFSGSLFEDAFFGHAKGAYTGAAENKPGFFEQAQGGTLFLDEIAELDPALQVKLLRVIQEGELYRIGSTRVIRVDVRILAATNRDINTEVRGGHFRADLFHRLNMYGIAIPPLRERKKDILPIARKFLADHAAANGKFIEDLAPDFIERLMHHPFYGNVRELENIIASAVLVETSRQLTTASAKDLAPSPITWQGTPDAPITTLADAEKQYILKVLDHVDGNRTQAARILDIGLRTLQRKLKTYEDEASATP